ncbi:unnamed protein product, partial [Ectocarpus sp. 4 AP-2014]
MPLEPQIGNLHQVGHALLPYLGYPPAAEQSGTQKAPACEVVVTVGHQKQKQALSARPPYIRCPLARPSNHAPLRQATARLQYHPSFSTPLITPAFALQQGPSFPHTKLWAGKNAAHNNLRRTVIC